MSNKNKLITKQKVYEVADALYDQGIKPTATNIRKVTGHGSYSTIGNHLSSWKLDKYSINIPDEIKKEFLSFAENIWFKAIKYTENKHEEQIAQLENEIQQLKIKQKK